MPRPTTPAIGDRVIVRRRLPDTPGHLTDVIGHVVALAPLTVRPQSVGGMVSTADPIVIPDNLIVVCRVLPPRTVRNSDIRAIECATAASFPGIEHTWVGSWLLRAGDGVTERSNSAAPLGPSALFDPVPIAEIEEFYAAHQLPTRLLLPDRIGRAAERIVAQPGWRTGPDILVLTADLDGHATDSTPPLPEGFAFTVDDQPDEDWLAMYHFRGTTLPRQALNLLRDQIDGRMGFARLTHHGDTVAITRATLTESPDGRQWLGYSAVEVAPEWRRRGLGTQVGALVQDWGAAHGAGQAYLQVVESNTAGRALYNRLGFVEHHRHRYAFKV
ncbi:GNAT family N-acetyltransferase [Corynebacterium sp. 13CS0277]|uniref:N-acetylglutamate synthase, CG3035 family n=1 Tax=Corynebacterium sp. 13CS0277 TaxID=2071994 RepID=UPI000D039D3A|nr:GNAT family N-acetyltransferase [Corynebacterium sp. 13CS0277]PRQ10582.1 GNAT family N-acetyltransferase [Corynebacterium sp. 13CS0277]